VICGGSEGRNEGVSYEVVKSDLCSVQFLSFGVGRIGNMD